MRASGSFEVQLVPQAPNPGDDSGIGRMTIDKTFQGELVGTSRGQMLSFMSPVQGSAGYVALERVTGTLHGHRGSFALLHQGLMDRGAHSLSIVVVPDSGSDELAGLTGRLDIAIEGKQHSYAFEYELPA